MPVQRGYICTNLITPGRKTLADIRVEAFDESMLVELEEELLKRDKQNYLLEVKKLKKTANSVMEGTSGMG